MKKTFNILSVRVFGIITILTIFIFSVATCSGQSINSIEELTAYLDKQPANSPDKPIKISMRANELILPKIMDVLNSAGKYVSLNLSGNTLTTIPDYTFYDEDNEKGCEMLVNVNIPNSVTSIGEGAFGGCNNLTAINVEPGNNAYSSQEGVLFNKDKTELISYPLGKAGEYTIPDSVKSIGEGVFADCTNLTNINIPNSVKNIGHFAFGYCTSLTNVTIPDSVTSMGGGVFYGCTSLKNVTIGNNITSINTYYDDEYDFSAGTFEDCTDLTSVIIGNGVTSIGERAFYGCTSLTAINVDPGNSAYSSQEGVLFNKDKTELISYPLGKAGEYTIPNSVKNIGNRAFANCTSLISITIPNSVTKIGSGAFTYCSGLTSVTIPNSVTSIASEAFLRCNNLTSVTFQGMISSHNFGSWLGNYNLVAFEFGLHREYLARGIGTYKTTAPVGDYSKWTKQ
jgi:hypothetical protein